ncbi:MAG: hypothetical protein ACRDEB_06265, partial [Chitinophagaceae bacterium]
VHDSEWEFYKELQQVIWKQIGSRLGLEGSAVKKEILFSKLQLMGVKEESVLTLQKILAVCEMGMFTAASPDTDKDKLLDETKSVFETLSRHLL